MGQRRLGQLTLLDLGLASLVFCLGCRNGLPSSILSILSIPIDPLDLWTFLDAIKERTGVNSISSRTVR